MQSGSKKQIDVARLKADVAAAGVELLSAHCAADRLRLRYTIREIVTLAEPASLKKAIASAQAMHRFFAQIEAHLETAGDRSR